MTEHEETNRIDVDWELMRTRKTTVQDILGTAFESCIDAELRTRKTTVKNLQRDFPGIASILAKDGHGEFLLSGTDLDAAELPAGEWQLRDEDDEDRAAEMNAEAATLAATASKHLDNGMAAEGAAYARAAAVLAEASNQLRRDLEK